MDTLPATFNCLTLSSKSKAPVESNVLAGGFVRAIPFSLLCVRREDETGPDIIQTEKVATIIIQPAKAPPFIAMSASTPIGILYRRHSSARHLQNNQGRGRIEDASRQRRQLIIAQVPVGSSGE